MFLKTDTLERHYWFISTTLWIQTQISCFSTRSTNCCFSVLCIFIPCYIFCGKHSYTHQSRASAQYILLSWGIKPFIYQLKMSREIIFNRRLEGQGESNLRHPLLTGFSRLLHWILNTDINGLNETCQISQLTKPPPNYTKVFCLREGKVK